MNKVILILLAALQAFSGGVLAKYDQMIRDSVDSYSEAREELRGFVPSELLKSKVMYYLEYKDHKEYQGWISVQGNRDRVFREDKN